jgi:hypothetical protein
MKLCSWPAGCAQETPNDAELCEYHRKLGGGLLGHSGEADKAVARRKLRRNPEGDRRPGVAREPD